MVARSKEFKKTELISRIKKIAYEFKEYIDLINSINVFPITDKDTGSNIYLTLKSFNERSSFQGVGNSGNILEIFGKEFLNGLPDSFKIADIKRAVEKAINKLEESILELKEGTIYTAIKKLKECLEQEKSAEETLKEIYNVVIESKTFIKQYTSQEVVDSGALGFLIILWLLNNKKPAFNFSVLQKSIKVNKEEIYCVNILCDDYEPEKLRTLDSVIINKKKNGYKIHFHSRDIKSALEFKNPKIIKIVPEPRKKTKEKMCYVTNNFKEKDFFNQLGLKTVSSLEEIITTTDPINTLYFIKNEQKRIVDKIKLDAIRISRVEELFVINHIISRINKINGSLLIKEMNKFALTEKPRKNDIIVFKISREPKDDSIYYPLLKEQQLFLIEKPNSAFNQ